MEITETWSQSAIEDCGVHGWLTLPCGMHYDKIGSCDCNLWLLFVRAPSFLLKTSLTLDFSDGLFSGS